MPVRGTRHGDDFDLVIGGAGESLLRLHGVVTDSVARGTWYRVGIGADTVQRAEGSFALRGW